MARRPMNAPKGEATNHARSTPEGRGAVSRPMGGQIVHLQQCSAKTKNDARCKASPIVGKLVCVGHERQQ